MSVSRSPILSLSLSFPFPALSLFPSLPSSFFSIFDFYFHLKSFYRYIESVLFIRDKYFFLFYDLYSEVFDYRLDYGSEIFFCRSLLLFSFFFPLSLFVSILTFAESLVWLYTQICDHGVSCLNRIPIKRPKDWVSIHG